MTRISDMTPVQVTAPTGMFAPVEKTGSTINYRVDLAAMSSVTPQMFGAVADGVTDDSAAFVAAIAYLKTFNLNAGGPDFYKGSPQLFVPAGHYFLGTTTLDVGHTLMIEGEGSGRAPAPAYGCTHLRWADGCDGIRTQAPNTSGAITVDGTTHDGSGGVYISNLTMEGGYSGTDANHNAITARTGIFITDVLIRNWSGTGVKGWTGNVIGHSPPNYAGNTSVSRLIGVKIEGCQIATDFRGTDSSVLTVLNCEAYQCRQAGFVDDNAAGASCYMVCHATFNGLISGSGYITQVYQTGNFYAVVWGQEVGAATNAPSGTTADNTWWTYVVAAGAADSSHPQWTNGMTNLAGGGDYIMLSAFGTTLVSCYVEGGGFSQLNAAVTVIGGSLLPLSSAGGSSLMAEYDGLSFKRLHSAAVLHFDGSDGALNGISSRDSTGERGNLLFGPNGADCIVGNVTGLGIWTLVAGVPTKRAAIDTTGMRVVSGALGYGTGVGAAVTQLTNKSTATPAINKVCGQVTMNAAALAGGAKVSFVVTNSTVAATDTIIVSIASGGTANAYRAAVTAISAGVSFTVTVENITGGSLSEAPVINFAILKAVAA